MKQFFLKFQLLFESLILLMTLALVFIILQPFQYRWDLTREKVYSLPRATTGVLRDMKNMRIEVLLFYQQDDPMKQGLEVFLKECQRYHPELQYNFYDPNRRPMTASAYHVTQPRSVVIISGQNEERLMGPTEEDFTNAFLRLRYPRNIYACFVVGHGEADLASQDPNGFSKYWQMLKDHNVPSSGIVLSRDHVPAKCDVIIEAGPHFELKAEEFADLKAAFDRGKSLLLLLDPMDPGTGSGFTAFAKEFGIDLGQNVIVDKTSRVVGGDFLMPVVSRYVENHPVTKGIEKASFYPLVRSVQSSTDVPEGLEIVPLAMTMDGSWAEADLPALENGTATFDVKTDIAGPLPVAVAVEQTSESSFQATDSKTKTGKKLPGARGRMIIVGDSDFLSNAYIELSGNRALGLNMVRWLAKDDRFVDVRRPELIFNPLLLTEGKRAELIFTVLVVFPMLFFIYGGLYLIHRSRTS